MPLSTNKLSFEPLSYHSINENVFITFLDHVVTNTLAISDGMSYTSDLSFWLIASNTND